MEIDELPYSATNTSNIINNITFSTEEKETIYAALVLEYANYGLYNNLFFNNIIGTALYIRSSWENYFDILNFRGIADFSKPCLRFAQARPISGVSANISASSFNKLMFENTSGQLIQSDVNSNFFHNQIEEINVELSYKLQNGESSYSITDTTDLTQMTPLYVFFGVGLANTINTINYTGLTAKESYYSAINNINYYFKGIFGIPDNDTSSDGNSFNMLINNIFLRKRCTLLSSNLINKPAFKLSIGQVISSTYIDEPFDLKQGASSININYFTDRNLSGTKLKRNNILLNSIDLYKYGNSGTIWNENTALNDLKLCLKKNPSVAILLESLFYPFNYSETSKHQFIIRCKGSGSFVLRGLQNGSVVNKTYTLADSSEWQNVIVDMNYDAFSPITILNANESIFFESLTHIGEVAL